MLKKLSQGLTIIICSTLLSVCYATPKAAPPTTATHVNLKRYLGTWYEIASFPIFFQRNCVCTRAQYSMKAGKFHIANICNKKTPDGKLKVVNAKGEVVPKSNNSKLKIQFFWPIKSNYWILYVDADYQHALVGTSNYKYLWMLSRTPTISAESYKKLASIATEKGYDINKFDKTLQVNCHY